jgi:hypothetical protein
MNLKSTAAGRGSFDLSLVIYCSLGTLEPNSAYTRMQECKNARVQECKKGLHETRDLLANAVARYRHPFATCKKRKQKKPNRVN